VSRMCCSFSCRCRCTYRWY